MRLLGLVIDLEVVPDGSTTYGDLLAATIRALDGSGVDVEDVALRRPTLDDVFLRLTGHPTDEEKTIEEAT